MSFLSRFFKRGSEVQAPRDIDAELVKLEGEAERAMPGYVGSAWNRAGDLALRSGRSDRAVDYYGRAIDAFLLDAQREAARGVANKIIRVRPAAVRTLCTLTWLDLASRHHATALVRLGDYVQASAQADERARAAKQIYSMARLSGEPRFLDAVADALDSLEYAAQARDVRAWSGTGAPDAIEDPTELADACLQAAVRSIEADDTYFGEPPEDPQADATERREGA